MLTSTIALTAAVLLAQPAQVQPNCGTLQLIDRDGKPVVICPLEQTKVSAQAQGLGVLVTVQQTFTNPAKEPLEAIYTFPLPADAAVSRMTLKAGDRLIEGEIKRREEARAIYEQARRAGQTAALLDQQRPNIFTQSIANLMPGAKVQVEITYVHRLKFEDGQFEFNYPMVVGPRFNPASVKDPNQVNPVVAPPGTRAGSTISLTLDIQAPGRISEARSVLHAVGIQNRGENRTSVTLSRKDEIPNRDFIFRWKADGPGVQTSFAAQAEGNGQGIFELILMPPAKAGPEDVSPKEVIFVMDQSGSQNGMPLQKSKELTKAMLQTLLPEDTFNLVTFSDSPRTLWPEPKTASEANVAEAVRALDPLQANGGTQFLPVINLVMSPPPPAGRPRLIVFNTDGFVGNEYEILTAVRRYRGNARMFTFGVGNSVNRFLIDAMGAEARGDSEIVTLAESADMAIARFVDRTRRPLLTDVTVKVEGQNVEGVTPEMAPDVFSEKPITVMGRYLSPGPARITVSGTMGGQPWSRSLNVSFPARGGDQGPAGVLWARMRVDDLKRRELLSSEDGRTPTVSQKEAITALGLRYRIMTEHTSFVAVEKRIVNVGGRQRTVEVPVDIADGVDPNTSGARGGGGPGAPQALSRTMAGSGGLGGGGGGFGGGGAGAAKAMEDSSAGRLTATPKDKISPKLAGKTGTLEVQIRVKAITPDLLAKLKAAGFTLDDQDKNLRTLFGRVKADALIKLAELEGVVSIDPL